MKTAIVSLRCKVAVAVFGIGLAGVAAGATYMNEVAAGVTQTFSQWETEKGITIVAGDTMGAVILIR